MVVLLVGAILVGVSLGGTAASGGIGNPTYAKKGCLCHGQGSTPATGPNPPGNPSAATSVTLTVENLTGGYVPGETYTLTIAVSNPSVQQVPSPMFVAGFGIMATNGTLANPDDNTQVKDSGVWATHTATGASQSQWSLTWTAPEGGNMTFHYAGNKVNGNRVNDPLDQWNRGTLALESAGAPAPPPANNTTDDDDRGGKDDTPGFGVVVVSLAVAAVALLVRRRRA